VTPSPSVPINNASPASHGLPVTAPVTCAFVKIRNRPARRPNGTPEMANKQGKRGSLKDY
jgi:hypothetical protein